MSPPALPVHVIVPQGRLTVPKVRAFMDFAVPRLRSHFAPPDGVPGPATGPQTKTGDM